MCIMFELHRVFGSPKCRKQKIENKLILYSMKKKHMLIKISYNMYIKQFNSNTVIFLRLIYVR